ncbi:cupin domain-containing protein [Chitinophagaceae bacterium MMS25-I14]
MKQEKQLIITGPEEGETLAVAGSNYRIVLTGRQTGGNMAIIEMNVPPHSGPVPHEHPAFQETFYVLEGEVEMRTKNRTFIARKGATVTIPVEGPVHCFRNNTETVARLLCIVAPAGLDDFFRAVAKPVAPGEMPRPLTDEDRQAIIRTAETYGQKLYPPDYLD